MRIFYQELTVLNVCTLNPVILCPFGGSLVFGFWIFLERYLVGVLSYVNHYGLYQGWKRISVRLLLTLRTSNLILTAIFYIIYETFHTKIYNSSLSKHFMQTSLQHSSYFIERIPLFWRFEPHISPRKSKITSGISFRKSEYKDLASTYLFLTSTKSAHSIKICLTMITASHITQTGASSFLTIEERVK